MTRSVPSKHLHDSDVADTGLSGDLAHRMTRVAGGADGVAVLLHGGSAPVSGALHTGERLHLQQGLSAIQQRLGLVHAALILKAQRLVNQVVGERDAVLRVRVNVLLGAGVQRVCGGRRSHHAGTVVYRSRIVKGLS